MSKRIEGLDLARLIAFFGMVVVNFNLLMGAPMEGNALALRIAHGLEGRAAAGFVVLAGVGLGLAFKTSIDHRMLLKRAAFLFVIGMINMLIFPADIIHYYAIYFVFSAWLLTLGKGQLWGAIFGINVIFVLGLLFLDYDAGWNWLTYDYIDFWSVDGFFRNLLFNGWHPVFPWLSFLAFGIWLARLDMAQKKVQFGLMIIGFAVYIANHFLVGAFQAADIDGELALLFTSSPVPPTPLYVIAGMSGASVLIGLSLLIAPYLQRLKILPLLLPAGRQSLTLYMAHIIVGMGSLEAMNMLTGQTIEIVWGAAIVFCLLAIVFAYIWSRWFSRGLIESVMRKICG